MENKINIAELLKDCPQGMELDCTMYEDVCFDYVDELNIIHCYMQHETHKTSITFNQHGTPNSDIKSKCVIFPKGKTTWEGYKWNTETKTWENLPKFKVEDKIEKYGYRFTIVEIKDNYYLTKCGNKIPIAKQDDWELVPNKFDINTLKVFDKVLVRDSNEGMWSASIFSHIWVNKYICIGVWYNQCIPYEGNEHLLGITNDCDDFYKTWE